MAKTLPSNSYWGRRSGSYEERKFNGHAYPVGRVFNQGQWGVGRTNEQGQGRSLRRKQRNLMGTGR